MKKLIALLLAVSALSLSSSAFAAVSIDDKFIDNTTIGTDKDKNLWAAEGDKYPCFTANDELVFTIDSATDGAQLTLISYKDGETADNSTIQYINQYTVGGTSQNISYKLRNLTDGIYNLKIKNGSEDVVTFKYKVATNSTAELAKFGSTTYFVTNADNNTTGVVIGAKRQSDDVTFAESAIYKLTINDDAVNVAAQIDAAAAVAIGDADVAGAVTALVGLTVNDVVANSAPTLTVVK